jgi:hypothetical protein
MRSGSYVARYADGTDPYTAFANEGGPGIQGKLLTCKKGSWGIGPDADPVKAGALFLMVVPSTMRGMLKWQANSIVNARVGFVADGFLMPDRQTLGDEDEARWETDPAGNPRDPWSKVYRVGLVEVAPPHGDVTFSGSSYGTQLALKDVCRTYSADAHLYPGALPIVALSTRTRTSKTYGKIIGPWFDVQGWATLEDVRAGRKKKAKAKAAPREGFNEAIGDELPSWGK